jgi:hypothetical protein
LSILEQNYFKVDIEYLQESQLLVVAKDEEAAVQMVKDNILETTKGFKVNGVSELSDEEKEWIIKNMAAGQLEATTEDEPQPMPERTLN